MKNNYLKNKFSEKSGIALHLCEFVTSGFNRRHLDTHLLLHLVSFDNILFIEAYVENVASQRYVVRKVF